MFDKFHSRKLLIADNERLTRDIMSIEKRNQIILDNSPVCTKIIDLDYKLQYMSASGVEALDIDDITAFYGKPYPLEFYPKAFKNDMLSSLKKCRETNETVIHEAPIIDLNGNTLWFHSTIVPINNDEGEIDYFLVYSTDITKFKTLK